MSIGANRAAFSSRLARVALADVILDGGVHRRPRTISGMDARDHALARFVYRLPIGQDHRAVGVAQIVGHTNGLKGVRTAGTLSRPVTTLTPLAGTTGAAAAAQRPIVGEVQPFLDLAKIARAGLETGPGRAGFQIGIPDRSGHSENSLDV